MKKTLQHLARPILGGKKSIPKPVNSLVMGAVGYKRVSVEPVEKGVRQHRGGMHLVRPACGVSF